MIIVLSPSKSVMKQAEPTDVSHTKPLFLEKTNQLVRQLQKHSVKELEKTLEVSPSLATLNYSRFKDWDHTPKRAALWLYSGDVYNGLDAYSLSASDISYAQKNLLIVSGLYGLVRPLDAIQPYRLEMKLPIKTAHSDTLYEFWQRSISSYLAANNPKTILICASKEYAKAVQQSLPMTTQTIVPRFIQETASGLKEKGLFAKYARGALARFALDNKVTNPKELKNYTGDGFVFSEDLSSDNEFVYIIPKAFSLKGRFVKK